MSARSPCVATSLKHGLAVQSMPVSPVDLQQVVARKQCWREMLPPATSYSALIQALKGVGTH